MDELDVRADDQKNQINEHLLLGDYFTHSRTGARFVCRAITRRDYAGKVVTRVELEIDDKINQLSLVSWRDMAESRGDFTKG